MASEAEHGEGDQGVGGSEAEGDAGHEADLGIHGQRGRLRGRVRSRRGSRCGV